MTYASFQSTLLIRVMLQAAVSVASPIMPAATRDVCFNVLIKHITVGAQTARFVRGTVDGRAVCLLVARRALKPDTEVTWGQDLAEDLQGGQVLYSCSCVDFTVSDSHMKVGPWLSIGTLGMVLFQGAAFSAESSKFSTQADIYRSCHVL